MTLAKVETLVTASAPRSQCRRNNAQGVTTLGGGGGGGGGEPKTPEGGEDPPRVAGHFRQMADTLRRPCTPP